MAVAKSFASWTYFDSTQSDTGKPESASFELPVTTLTAGNVAAQATLVDALTTAIEALVLGNLNKTSLIFEREIISEVPANDQFAQRGIKLLCRYHDAAVPSRKYRCSIPTFDLEKLPLHSEFLDLTAGDGAALKTAFEAVVKSAQDAANAVVLDSAQYID
jgi:hypothetical protein